MNNFFYRDSDYDLFKKALRTTKNEPVVINILSNDSSLMEENNGEVVGASPRKQMSTKFQASPFDKFFGPRKKRTDPLDMKDFSAWRNKNYRESEKQINETPEEVTKFSFADYLNNKAKKQKYNDEDQLKSDNQKSIEQISSGDADFKKFSLDSYLNKLEQETKARKDFEESEDLFTDNKEDLFKVEANSEQDENFMSTSDVDVEDIAFGGTSGEKFAFDREELDSVKARLEKMEREANNIKDKPTTRVISSNDIDEMTGKDEEFDLDKLGIEDDIERVNEKINSLNKALQITGDEETESPKVEHNKFVEVNKNFEDESEIDEDEELAEDTDIAEEIDQLDDIDELDENDVNQISDGVVEPVKIDGFVASDDDLMETEDEDVGDEFVDVLEMPENKSGSNVNVNIGSGGNVVDGFETDTSSTINKTDDYLTKADFKDFTEEIVNKFSEMYRGTPDGASGVGSEVTVNPYQPGYVDTNQMYTQTTVGADQSQNHQIYQQNSELQAKIVELLEQNKKSDQEVAERLKLAEIEKQRVADKYEARLRELEESMRQREEDVKQQVYIEKLKNDIKFKKSESKYKLREEQIRESEKLSTENQLASEKLKAELRNYLDVSNLEMDKKLLECVNKLHKEAINARQENEERKEEVVEEIEEVEEVKRPVRTRARSSRPAARRRTSTVKSRMRTRTPRRKIDSDIIGGINFD